MGSASFQSVETTNNTASEWGGAAYISGGTLTFTMRAFAGEGDVIVKMNDAVLDSVPAFRREVRRGVVLESAVLQLRRKGEALTRIVFFNGIPIDPARVAPPPRKAGW